MRTSPALLSVLGLSLAPACSAPLAGDPGSGGAPPGRPVPSETTAPLVLTPPDLVAWTATGDLALADGRTGAVLGHLALSGAGGAGDLAWDPWAGRVLMARSDGDEGGDVSAVAVHRGRRGPAFGEAVLLAWIDGEARVLATPAGPVAFERGYADRWRLLGAKPSAGVSAPPPASVWLTTGRGGTIVHGLAWEDGAPSLTRWSAAVGAAGVSPPAATALSVASATQPPTARLVPARGAGDAVLIDVAGTALALRRVAGGAAGPAALVPLAGAARRIEGAVALHHGAVAMVLLSGGAEAEVVAMSIDPAGAVCSVAHLALPGAVAPASPYFSGDLAVQGPEGVLAATSAGVHAVVVAYDGAGVRLSLAGGFDGSALRGPIAVLDPPP